MVFFLLSLDWETEQLCKYNSVLDRFERFLSANYPIGTQVATWTFWYNSTRRVGRKCPSVFLLCILLLFAPFRTIILFLSRSLVPKGLLTLFILILEWTNGLIRTLTCRAEYAADRKRTEEWGVTKIRAFFAFFYIRINFDPDTIFCGTSKDKYTDWDASQGTLSPWSFSPVEKRGKLCLVPL